MLQRYKKIDFSQKKTIKYINIRKKNISLQQINKDLPPN